MKTEQPLHVTLRLFGKNLHVLKMFIVILESERERDDLAAFDLIALVSRSAFWKDHEMEMGGWANPATEAGTCKYLPLRYALSYRHHFRTQCKMGVKAVYSIAMSNNNKILILLLLFLDLIECLMRQWEIWLVREKLFLHLFFIFSSLPHAHFMPLLVLMISSATAGARVLDSEWCAARVIAHIGVECIAILCYFI